MGRREEGLLRQHLRRPVQVCPRVLGQPVSSGHHTLDRSLLHHADTVSALDYGWRAGRSSRYGQDRDDQGSWQSARFHGVCVQLLGADGLQVVWQYL